MKKGIIVDLDSTIWDINDLCIPAAERLFGEPYTREELTHWDALKDKYGDNFFNIYTEGLKVEDIPKRKLYEGAAEVLLRLHEEFGFIIHFITHNEAIPNEMEIYLEKWIHDSIPDLKFYMTVLNKQRSKIDFANGLRIYDLVGLLDDKPATIEEAVSKNIPLISAKRHLYNEEVRSRYPQVQEFDSWWEVPDLLNRKFDAAWVLGELSKAKEERKLTRST